MGAWYGPRISPVAAQRLVFIVIVGALLVLAAYLWGSRLLASPEESLSQAPRYASLYGVAGVRAVDSAALRDAAAAASVYAGLNGVAAARAADDALARSAASASASQFRSLRGVAAVRAEDAESSSGGSFNGVAAVRAVDSGQ
jgi:hypothetical protein